MTLVNEKMNIEPMESGSVFKYEEIKKLGSGSQGNVYLFGKFTAKQPLVFQYVLFEKLKLLYYIS